MNHPGEVDEYVEVDAEPFVAWQALAGPKGPSWWNGMELDARDGGSFVERWTDAAGIDHVTRGRVVECDPPQRLVLTWADEDWPSQTVVTISIESLDDDRSRLRVRHHGWECLPGLDELIPAHRDGWLHHLRAWAAACTATG